MNFFFQVDFVDSVPACFETIFYSCYEILSYHYVELGAFDDIHIDICAFLICLFIAVSGFIRYFFVLPNIEPKFVVVASGKWVVSSFVSLPARRTGNYPRCLA